MWFHTTICWPGGIVAGIPGTRFCRFGIFLQSVRPSGAGDAAAIGQFCSKNYGVTFPLSGKIAVNGAQAHPLSLYLTRSAPGLLGTEAIKWNFTKFLLDRNGEVVARYAPTTKPADLTAEIERLLSIPPVEV
jgi:glutathione peroxidase-family protein